MYISQPTTPFSTMVHASTQLYDFHLGPSTYIAFIRVDIICRSTIHLAFKLASVSTNAANRAPCKGGEE